MEEQHTVRRPTQDEVDQLQIEEYIANNPHGPGDHRITGVELLMRLFGRAKE